MKNWKNKKIWFVLLIVLALVLYIGSSKGADGAADSAGQDTAMSAIQDTAETDLDEATPTQTAGDTDEATPTQTASDTDEATPTPTAEPEPVLDPDGSYTSCEDVALYLKTYGELPGNFITKKEAQSLGWSGGSLESYAPGKCIGGDKFGNYEGSLPKADGRVYHECDIDTLGAKSRGAKRIVYSNDGLIYYTEDHYENFTLLYE